MIPRRFKIPMVPAAILMLLTGCRPVDLSQPPVIRYGEEACAHCRMIIGDERFAAAIVSSEGDTSKFDDVGCLVEYSAEHPPGGEVAYWVRSTAGAEWLKADQAAYVHGPEIHSPMGYGLSALPSARFHHPHETTDETRPLHFSDLRSFLSTHHRQGGLGQDNPPTN